MQLPPFTAKSALVYMIGVVALLLGLYFLVGALYHAQPHQRILPDTSSAPSGL